MLLVAPTRSKIGTVFLCVVIAVLVAPAAPAGETDEASELYYSANALYNRKLYRLACEEYLAFLQAHPDHEKGPQATYGLALCHYALGSFKKAEPLLAGLRDERRLENRQEIANLHGQCLLALDRPEPAEEAFAWSAARSGDATAAARGLAGLIESRYRQSKWKEVAADSDRFLERYPDSDRKTRVTFQGAVSRFELGRYADAGMQLATLLDEREKTPFMQHVAFLLAECNRELGERKEAARLYELAGRALTGSFTSEALYRLGVVRFREGNHAAAEEAFLEVARDHESAPVAPRARLYLGRCQLETGKLALAEKTFAAFKETDPLRLEARLWLARCYCARKQPARAERILERALKAKSVSRNPFHADLLHELAGILMEQGRHAEAAGTFGAAADRLGKGTLPSGGEGTSRAARIVEARWLEAYCLHKAGSFEESRARCVVFLRQHPKAERRGDLSFLEAENLFMLGKYGEAAPLFARFGAAFTDHFYAATARFRLAQSYYHADRWNDAREALKALPPGEAKKPFFRQAGFISGDCAFRLGEWERAATLLDAFAAKHPDEPNADGAAYKAAVALERMGQPDRACAALEAFPARFPKSSHGPNAAIELGRLHYDAGRFEEARSAFARAGRKGDNPHALYYLGYVALAEGDEPGAVEQFRSFTRRFPRHALAADALLQQGVLNTRLGEYRKARSQLRSFLEGNPAHAKTDQALFHLGLAAARQKDWDGAEEHFGALLAGHPRSSLADRALYEWAWCEKGRDRPDQAALRYETLLKRFPGSPLAAEVLFEMAEIDYEQKEHDRAVARLETVAGLDPDPDLRERTLYRLGWNRFAAGDMAGSAADFERMVREFPASTRRATALYQAGEARLALREYEDAYTAFKELCGSGTEGDELAEQALLRLGECAALTSRWEEAESVYRTFTDRYPESRFLNRALFGRGWALQNQNRNEEAIDAFRKVLARGKKDETSARSQFQIGECLFAMKEYNEAVKALIKVEVLYSFPGWSSKALLETGRALEIPGNIGEARERYRELIEKYPESDAAVVARRRLDRLETL